MEIGEDQRFALKPIGLIFAVQFFQRLLIALRSESAIRISRVLKHNWQRRSSPEAFARVSARHRVNERPNNGSLERGE